MNNEAKPRRSTRVDKLDQRSGQVLSYEHLQDKRLKRVEDAAAKEAKAKARGKNGQKGKNAAQDTAEATASTDTLRRGRKRKSTESEAETGPSVRKGKVARMSDIQAVEATEMLETPPVAKLY